MGEGTVLFPVCSGHIANVADMEGVQIRELVTR
jgi:hypothetical protein